MVSNLVVYQLALIALVWLFLMLSWVVAIGARSRSTATTHASDATTQTLHSAPTLPGLTRKPHCDACEQTIEDRQASAAFSSTPEDHLNPWTSAPCRHPHAISVPMRTVAMAAG